MHLDLITDGVANGLCQHRLFSLVAYVSVSLLQVRVTVSYKWRVNQTWWGCRWLLRRIVLSACFTLLLMISSSLCAFSAQGQADLSGLYLPRAWCLWLKIHVLADKLHVVVCACKVSSSTFLDNCPSQFIIWAFLYHLSKPWAQLTAAGPSLIDSQESIFMLWGLKGD